MRKIHKWVFIFVGVFVLLWVTTGIFMELPFNSEWSALGIDKKEISNGYESAKLTPADAIAEVRKTNPLYGYIRSVRFEVIQNRIYYVIKDKSRKVYIIDAYTGREFTLSYSDAEQLVRTKFSIKEPVIEKKLIKKHAVGYMWGKIPVYQFRFEGGGFLDTYYIDPDNSKIYKSTFMVQAKEISGYLHTLGPIKALTGSNRVQNLAMLIIAAVALLGTITGIYLTLPNRRRETNNLDNK